MREIKFRGQICKGLANEGLWICWGIEGTDLIDSIDHDTIGQFTGLRDKNGMEIYEGDIVGRTDEQIWSVQYDESMASFVVYNQLNSFRRVEESITKTTIVDGIHEPVVIISVTDEIEIEAEVIGNIHENPELLEIENDYNIA